MSESTIDAIKLYSNIYYSQVKESFTDIYEAYQYADTISKEDLLEILPRYLNKSDTTKSKIIELWNDEVTEVEFINLLNTQTEGYEYLSFEYYILKHNLKFDSNHMIIFTNEFPFNNKVKKEALFIWGIINALRNHELIGPYIDLFNLQSTYETNFIESHRRKKFDMEFPYLNIVIEIDENHIAKKIKKNDALKTTLVAMNGNILLRMNFQKIDKRKLKNGDNFNISMLNSKYYKEFLNELYDAIIASLLNNDVSFRRNYIFHLFDKSLHIQASTIEKNMVLNNRNITSLAEKIKTYKQQKRKNELRKQIADLHNIQEINLKSLNDLKETIEFIKTDTNFIKLFELKQKYRSRIIGNKNIPVVEILDILNIRTEDHFFKDFMTFLYSNKIISIYYASIQSIYISWKELGIIINGYHNNVKLSTTLILYYFELEESYEDVISRIHSHTDKLKPSKDKYNTCVRYENKKVVKKYKKIIKKLKNDYSILEDDHSKNNKSLDKLSEKFISLNISYNKLYTGELNHQRSKVNIKFNNSRLITDKPIYNSDSSDSELDSNVSEYVCSESDTE